MGLIAEPLGCIYQATCLVTGKIYVGITIKGMEERKRMHLKNARDGLHYHFYRSIRKHGETAFEWEIISDGHTWPELCALERETIALYKWLGLKLVNMTNGGDGAPGLVWSEESRKRASTSGKKRFQDPSQIEWNRQKSLGKPNTPEQRAKISAAMKGVPKSDKTRRRMSAAQKKIYANKVWTDEMRASMAERAKKNVLSPEARARISAKLKGVPKNLTYAQRAEKSAKAKVQGLGKTIKPRMEKKNG